MPKQKIVCIYIITSKIKTKRFYIGSSYDFEVRKRKHLKDLRRGVHHSVLLQRHINKYGLEDINFQIVENLPKNINNKNLLEREQYYMDLHDPFFNICKVAGNCKGIKHTAATRKKMSERFKGRVVSEETRRKISEGHKGKKLSPEHIEKMRQNAIGKVQSEESNRKRSLSLKGRIISEEHRQKLIDINTGRKMKPEHRKKMSESAKNRKRTKRGKYNLKPRSQRKEVKVKNIKDVLIYKQLNDNGMSTNKIGQKFGIDGSTIRKYIRKLKSGALDQELAKA